MTLKNRAIFALILLGIMDAVIPVPIIGLILIHVILQKPPWFLDLVKEIYLSE